MTPAERVKAAIDFKSPDKVPVEYYYTPVGFYEHGEKLNDLYEAHEGDFAPFVRAPLPHPGPECFDNEGRYHQKIRDEWGTVWEYRIFGIAGIECEYPLDDWEKLKDYAFPAQPSWVTTREGFQSAKTIIDKHRENYYYKHGCFSLFERIIALRPFEDILCDLYTENRDLSDLMDRLCDYYEKQISKLIEIGVDCIHFGDDFGTQENLIFSPDIFRKQFKPRYERLMKPIRDAGVKISFHSCGMVEKLLPDLKDLGVNAIWPQLPLYDMKRFADELRDMQIALAIHTDRANTMTYGTPEDVEALVRKEFEIFRPDRGGSWFYIEPDNGMPFENIKALIETVYSYR